MHLYFRNCNDAFRELVTVFDDRYSEQLDAPVTIKEKSSRVGSVLRIIDPVTITYRKPLERVLFNEARDANPFFHLLESLWMLAGRNDVEPMAYYNSNIAKVASDDGEYFHGAYGKRWRSWFGYDQLEEIIYELKARPDSRRLVLAMWDACCCEECKGVTANGGAIRHDLYMATHGGKDVPCNTHAYFEIDDGELNMTVCNRSNDLEWGMLGANVVHFSFLQEYLSLNIGVQVGKYHQISNNLHCYTERFRPKQWLEDTTPDAYTLAPRINYVRLVTDPATFELELPNFVARCIPDANGDLPTAKSYDEPFLKLVALPAVWAYRAFKLRHFRVAVNLASEICADDWRIACVSWLRRRQAAYEQRETLDNPMLKNELDRQDSGSEHAL